MSSPGYLVLMFTLDTQTFKMYSLSQVATILYSKVYNIIIVYINFINLNSMVCVIAQKGIEK